MNWFLRDRIKYLIKRGADIVVLSVMIDKNDGRPLEVMLPLIEEAFAINPKSLLEPPMMTTANNKQSIDHNAIVSWARALIESDKLLDDAVDKFIETETADSINPDTVSKIRSIFNPR